MANHQSSNDPFERDKADTFSRPPPRLAQLRGEEDQEIQAQIRQREAEARVEEENALRATTEILKTRHQAAEALASSEPIKPLFESDSSAERERKEENIRTAIRRLIGSRWSCYIALCHASEYGADGALKKTEQAAREIIDLIG
ncbi:hypothetical protein JCM5353_004390, partial [Sporobolomyces roseus]